MENQWIVLLIISNLVFLITSILFVVLWRQSVEDNNATWDLYDTLRDECGDSD